MKRMNDLKEETGMRRIESATKMTMLTRKD